MATKAEDLTLTPGAQKRAFQRFGVGGEPDPTLFEGTASVEPTVEPEFTAEVEADLPEGDAIGMAEARADYLLQRIAAEHERICRINAAAEARAKMIKDHATEEITKAQRRVDWLQMRVREVLPGDADRFKKLYGKKSVSLPHGQIGFRQHRATVEIQDAAKALAFAKERGLEITVKESVGKTPLIEHVIRTGEEPEAERAGFAFVPASDSFYIAPELVF